MLRLVEQEDGKKSESLTLLNTIPALELNVREK